MQTNLEWFTHQAKKFIKFSAFRTNICTCACDNVALGFGSSCKCSYSKEEISPWMALLNLFGRLCGIISRSCYDFLTIGNKSNKVYFGMDVLSADNFVKHWITFAHTLYNECSPIWITRFGACIYISIWRECALFLICIS